MCNVGLVMVKIEQKIPLKLKLMVETSSICLKLIEKDKYE